ncbi:MAG: hypothetical protein HY664_02530 [Chloroflexi bacterium]|nr:hypothetical protein [Chloroflexota bacterium]
MKTGFSHEVAPRLIRESPGMTSDEVAKLALSNELCSSDAKDPVRSLGNTLAKEVREGRLPEIVARRDGNILRYYPKDTPSTIEPNSGYESISIRLNRFSIEQADLLVEVERFKNRSEALAWLIDEGIRTNEEFLKEVREGIEKIGEIKRSLQVK